MSGLGIWYSLTLTEDWATKKYTGLAQDSLF